MKQNHICNFRSPYFLWKSSFLERALHEKLPIVTEKNQKLWQKFRYCDGICNGKWSVAISLVSYSIVTEYLWRTSPFTIVCDGKLCQKIFSHQKFVTTFVTEILICDGKARQNCQVQLPGFKYGGEFRHSGDICDGIPSQFHYNTRTYFFKNLFAFVIPLWFVLCCNKVQG